ncbi:MAG: DinB family protein [Acidobacteria bacterium]|nr:MAG: DinB family protein [Acidobacteriota bacterium]
MSTRPAATEISPVYQRYFDLVPEDDIQKAIADQAKKTAGILRGISEEKAAFRYAPGKWSVKGVVGHFTDAERIFGYRTLAIARGETKSLPGFDENSYGQAGDFDRRSIRDLADDYEAARRSTIAMLRGIPDAAWSRRGVANEVPVNVLGLAYIILGHERHHLRVLHDRYGV